MRGEQVTDHAVDAVVRLGNDGLRPRHEEALTVVVDALLGHVQGRIGVSRFGVAG